MNLSIRNIGYVGVGLMGLPMVKRLISLGYSLNVFDVSADRMTQARDAGAQLAASAAEAALGAEVVVLNLPTPEAVEIAMFGTGHGESLARAMKPPQLLLDFSTIKVEQGRAYATRLYEASACHWVDAPVSGGPPASGSGSLTIMAGGRAEDLLRLNAFMKDISARCTHMGPVGSGLAAKMLNQLIVGCLHVVMAEAAAMAENSGIDAAKLPECLAGGHADGTLLQRLYPRMVQRDFAPQGYVRQLTKDLDMVKDFAFNLNTPIPMLTQALSMYEKLMQAGHSELDTSAVFKLYKS